MAFDTIWEEIHKNQEWGKYPSEHVIRFCARNFYSKDRKSTKLLDFGCGGGAHTWYLAREGFNVYAFDGSESAIKKLTEKLKCEGLRAELEVMQGTDLGYPDSIFDGIIDNVCIYSNMLADINKMYKECYRTLKCGGKIMTSVFSEKTLGYGTGVEVEKGTYRDISCGRLAGRGTAHFFGKGDVEKIMSQIGFKNLKTDILEYTDNGELVSMYIIVGEK